MTKQKNHFLGQLENFDREVGNATIYFYADLAIGHAMWKSKKLLDRINDAPTFWGGAKAAFQTAAYMSISRIFDENTKFNIDELLKKARTEKVFTREALSARVADRFNGNKTRLDDYLDKAYYPNAKDFSNFQRRTDKFRKIYERAVKPARNKCLAHREKALKKDIDSVFAKGKISDLYSIINFCNQFYLQVWELYNNGHKPHYRPVINCLIIIWT